MRELFSCGIQTILNRFIKYKNDQNCKCSIIKKYVTMHKYTFHAELFEMFLPAICSASPICQKVIIMYLIS